MLREVILYTKDREGQELKLDKVSTFFWRNHSYTNVTLANKRNPNCRRKILRLIRKIIHEEETKAMGQ